MSEDAVEIEWKNTENISPKYFQNFSLVLLFCALFSVFVGNNWKLNNSDEEYKIKSNGITKIIKKIRVNVVVICVYAEWKATQHKKVLFLFGKCLLPEFSVSCVFVKEWVRERECRRSSYSHQQKSFVPYITEFCCVYLNHIEIYVRKFLYLACM